MLLALSSASRCSELAHLDVNKMKYLPNGAKFQLVNHKKNKKAKCLPGEIFFPSIPAEPKLCPVSCLSTYIARTKSHRNKDSDLFRSFIKPFGKVTPTTVSRWLTQVIILAGGPVLKKKLKGHSVRGAATSVALDKGLSIKDIIKAGDWKQDSVFFKHYYHPSDIEKFGKTVLSVKQMAEN